MANFFLSNAAAIAALDAVVDLVDGGAAAGQVNIYAGTEPADADTAITTQTLLAEITLADPAFGAASDAAPGATASANGLPKTDTSANATGTATFFRVLDSDSNVIMQGDVTATAGGGDMTLNSTSIVSGAAVRITSFTATMPES